MMSRHLRVLLGDPPVDWDTVRSAKDYGTWDRDGHPAEIIRREVLARGRRALVIYGDLHFIRKNIRPVNAEDDSAKSIAGLLEKAGAKVFSIRTIAYGIDQPDVLSWPRPSLAMLRGTALGTASFSSYYPRPLVVGTDGKPRETPDDRRPLRMEEQFDALLYLWPPVDHHPGPTLAGVVRGRRLRRDANRADDADGTAAWYRTIQAAV